MTAVLAQNGQIVIPEAIRDQMNLEAGDRFEVDLLDVEIVLRPLPKARNQGLADILLNPPGKLEISEREEHERLAEAQDDLDSVEAVRLSLKAVEANDVRPANEVIAD